MGSFLGTGMTIRRRASARAAVRAPAWKNARPRVRVGGVDGLVPVTPTDTGRRVVDFSWRVSNQPAFALSSVRGDVNASLHMICELKKDR